MAGEIGQGSDWQRDQLDQKRALEDEQDRKAAQLDSKHSQCA